MLLKNGVTSFAVRSNILNLLNIFFVLLRGESLRSQG